MKKIALFLITALLVGSCSLFHKPSMTQDEIDQMVAEKQKLQQELKDQQASYEAEIQKMKDAEQARIMEQQQKEAVEGKSGTGRYYVIAGSFKIPENASNYAEKIRQSGGEGTVVKGPWNFKLVAYSSHSSLSEALNKLEEVRTNITEDAWVYMDR